MNGAIRAITWPVTPVIPPDVAPGRKVASAWGNSVTQCLDDLWTDLQAVGAVTIADPTSVKGDLLARSATALARLPVGANGTALLADSAQPLGVRWGPVVTDAVPTSRQVIAGTGLSGGGALSADVTLSVVDDTTLQRLRIASNGGLVGTRRELNFIQGANVVLTFADDAVNNRVNVTLNSSGSGGGSQTPWLSNIDAAGFGLNNAGPITTTGPAIASVASSGVFDYTGGSTRFLSRGTDAATSGGFLFYSTRGDGSVPALPLMITPGGFVGINQNPPAYRLDVGGDVNITGTYRVNGVPISTGGGGQNQTPWLSSIDAAGFNLSNVGFVGVNSALVHPAEAGYEWWTGGFSAAGLWQVTHRKVADNSWVIPLTIHTNNFVGIGALTPEAQLHVAQYAPSATGPVLLLQNTGGNIDTMKLAFRSSATDRGDISCSVENGAPYHGRLKFSTGIGGGAYAERMVITDNGNVGIGGEPAGKLHVQGGTLVVQSGTVYDGIRLKRSDGADMATLVGFNGADNDCGGLDLYWGSVLKARINAHGGIPSFIPGSFAIGHASPLDPLHILSTTGWGVRIVHSADSSYTRMGANSYNAYLGNDTAGQLYIQSHADNLGFVVIGTGTGAGPPYPRLHVGGGDLGVGGGAWNNGRFRLGTHYLWVDASSRLRIKSSSPTSDTDGVVVGTQA